MNYSYYQVQADVDRRIMGYDDDGIFCQLVTVIMSDEDGLIEPSIGTITAAQAREFAFELLAAAEHADQLTHERRGDR
ncbi:MAG: hypothetical protein ACRDQX_13570 [Pseudonocardiaceae bacterium]